MSFRSVLKDIADVYTLNSVPPEFDISNIKDFEKAKNNITRRIISYERNKELLKNMPHKICEDLAIIYQINVGNHQKEGEIATVKVNNTMFEHYDISLEELDAIAAENTPRIFKPSIDNLADIIFGNTKDYIKETFGVDDEQARDIFLSTYEIPDNPMVYVGNKEKVYGAVSILDEKVQDDLAEIFGSRYCVIPSSVHEVLVIPFEGDFSEFNTYEEIINSVNEDCLSVQEILSNKVYMVDARNHVFLQMERAEEYFKEQEKKQEEQKEMIQEETDKMIPEAQIKRQRLP